jgi:hypothetical protein
MVSLLQLAQVTEEGVRFLSPHDKSPMYAQTKTKKRQPTSQQTLLAN